MFWISKQASRLAYGLSFSSMFSLLCSIQRFRCLAPGNLRSIATKKNPLLMCNRCDIMKDKKLFKHSYQRNRDTCLLCGYFCGGRNISGRAYTCQKHTACGGLSNGITDRCWICNSVIFLSNKFLYFELKLCTICGQNDRCVKLIIRDELWIMHYRNWRFIK